MLRPAALTLIGNKEQVALELVEGPVGFCGARIWLASVPFGSADLYAPAGALAEGLAHFRRRVGKRVHPQLFAEPSETCLATVLEGLFGDATDLEDAVARGEEYGALLLSPNLCESLDDCEIVVVSNGAEQRILAKRPGDGQVAEVRLEQGTIEQVFEAAEGALVRFHEQRGRVDGSSH